MSLALAVAVVGFVVAVGVGTMLRLVIIAPVVDLECDCPWCRRSKLTLVRPSNSKKEAA